MVNVNHFDAAVSCFLTRSIGGDLVNRTISTLKCGLCGALFTAMERIKNGGFYGCLAGGEFVSGVAAD
jgi:hypothetical protein